MVFCVPVRNGEMYAKNLLRKMKKHIDRSGIILYTDIRRLDV